MPDSFSIKSNVSSSIPDMPDFQSYMPNTGEIYDKYVPDTSEWLPEMFQGETALDSEEKVIQNENKTFR